MKINFPKPLLRILEDNSCNTVDENSLQNCIRCKIPKATVNKPLRNGWIQAKRIDIIVDLLLMNSLRQQFENIAHEQLKTIAIILLMNASR